MRDTRIADEQHARLVAVTDSPANEIWVRLTAQASLDHVFDKGERRRVSGVFKGVENGRAVFTREVELPARARIEIVRDDSIDLRTKWLNGDCADLAV